MLHAPPQTAKDALLKSIEHQRISTSLGNNRAVEALRKAVPAFRRGDYKNAAIAAAEAADADAASAVAFHLLALSLDNLGERHKAFQMYERALALDPADPEIYLNIGTAASQLRLFDGAITAFRTYIELRPNCPKGYNNLAGTLRDKGDLEEAIEVLRNAIQIMPEAPQLWVTLGTVMGEQSDFTNAGVFYREALRLDPKMARGYHNLAHALNHTGPFEDALDNYDRALKLVTEERDRIEMLHARGLCKVAMGRLEEGWVEYEQRHNPRFIQSNLYVANAPLWEGEDISDKTLLLIGEQGLGDEIMFAELIPDMIERVGPNGRVLLACDHRLVALMQRSFPQIQVGPTGHLKHNAKTVRLAPWAKGALKPDVYAPLGTPLQYIRNHLEDFRSKPFLKPEPARVGYWRERLSDLGPGPYVGICWRSMLLTTQRRKFFSPMEAWRAPLSLKNIKFINLQYGDCREDLAYARDKLGATIHNFEDLDLKNNLDDNAALCAALDLATTAPTAAAALAAGTGTETWFLTAGRVWPQLGTDHYPWYAKTRVLTPDTFGDWPTLMQTLAADLAKL
jgi:tetratricopeptide (TPR) repeat protein